MTLTFEQIKEITQGVEEIKSTFDGIQFFRFTEKELKHRKDVGNGDRSYSSAGVRLEFETDSKSLYIKFNVKATMQRVYMALDVLVNGERIGSVRNSPEDELLGTFFAINPYEWKDKVFEGKFELGEGTKKVSIYFPWNHVMCLKELTLDDGSFVKRAPRSKKMLVLGDSITHGFDAICPSRSYASLMTAALDAEEYNKAIGGDKFCKEIADTLEERTYDYVSIAYGTNDWCVYDYETAKKNCEEFFEIVENKFKGSKFFVLGPIWRADYTDEMKFGKPFCEMEKMIFEIASKYENTYCVPGFDLVDHDTALYGDHKVHPNDNGFKQYAERLYSAIEKYID